MKHTLTLVLFLALAAQGSAGAEPKGEALFFANARVFDGTKLLPRASVLVQGGRIAAVGPDIAAPARARIIESQGKTLLPGFIDSHTHVFGPDVLRVRSSSASRPSSTCS